MRGRNTMGKIKRFLSLFLSVFSGNPVSFLPFLCYGASAEWALHLSKGAEGRREGGRSCQNRYLGFPLTGRPAVCRT